MNTPADTLVIIILTVAFIMLGITIFGLFVNFNENKADNNTSDNNPLANMSDSELADYGIAQAKARKLAKAKLDKIENYHNAQIEDIQELRKYI